MTSSKLGQFGVGGVFIMIWRFNNNFMVPNRIPQVFVLHDLFLVFGLFGRAKSGVKVWDNADKPVFWALASQRILATLNFAVLLFGRAWWRAGVMFSLPTHMGQTVVLAVSCLGLAKVYGSATSFSCDYDPAVKQVVFSKFIIRHG
jgi:hypothetical protein